MSPPTDLAGLSLVTPVISAAGCGGSGRELEPYVDLARLGAFTTRTLTLDRQPGHPAPRLVPTAGGVLCDSGGHNPGLQGFLATELPWLAQRGVRTIVSIAGRTLADYAELARTAGSAPGIAAVEVELSGRYAGGPAFDLDPFAAGKAVHVVRRDTPRGVPVLVKLTPGSHLAAVARQVVHEGADALVIGHGLPGLVFDPATGRPALSGDHGSLSGPAMLPLAVRAVADVHDALPGTPVVGAGGVRSGADAFQLLLAGASAVAVGTALLADPASPGRIADELAALLARHDLTSPAGIVGRGLAHAPPGETS